MKSNRQDEIIRLLARAGNIKMSGLVEHFGVSMETIRRDVSDLVRMGRVKKVYGGIQYISENVLMVEVESWNKRMKFNRAEKERIANCAVDLIPDGATVLLDSGTTTHYLAKLLNIKQDLTLITYSIITAGELSRCCDHDVYMIGGHLRKNEQVTTGVFTRIFLETMTNIDLFVSTADGISLESGVMDLYEDVADVKRQFVARANTTIVLADNSKFGQRTSFRTCGLDKIHSLVTDANTPAEYLEGIRSAGVRVYVAEEF